MNQDEVRASIKAERDSNNPDAILIDEDRDTITMYGVTYRRDVFRVLRLGTVGTLYRLDKREDGVICIIVYPPGEQVTA